MDVDSANKQMDSSERILREGTRIYPGIEGQIEKIGKIEFRIPIPGQIRAVFSSGVPGLEAKANKDLETTNHKSDINSIDAYLIKNGLYVRGAKYIPGKIIKERNYLVFRSVTSTSDKLVGILYKDKAL